MDFTGKNVSINQLASLPHKKSCTFLKQTIATVIEPPFQEHLSRAGLTSGEEPVGVLDDGLDDAHDLQRHRGHHLRDVSTERGSFRHYKRKTTLPMMLLQTAPSGTGAHAINNVLADASRGCREQRAATYASVWVHSRLGPSTMAMLPGVILLASWYSVSLDKNLIRYLKVMKKRFFLDMY